ncbi:hypothetical protein [Ferrimicrobium acidiphilum]|uniref:Uncharacterized protein n=1 Tax=Ferrimicrobium acidiphilum TaxID=121039 RepID=A0ABV3Y8P1_9ACTN
MRGSDDRRAALRSAIFDGDGQRVVAALSKGLRGDLLQLTGDGLLVALAEGAAGGVRSIYSIAT